MINVEFNRFKKKGTLIIKNELSDQQIGSLDEVLNTSLGLVDHLTVNIDSSVCIDIQCLLLICRKCKESLKFKKNIFLKGRRLKEYKRLIKATGHCKDSACTMEDKFGCPLERESKGFYTGQQSKAPVDYQSLTAVNSYI